MNNILILTYVNWHIYLVEENKFEYRRKSFKTSKSCSGKERRNICIFLFSLFS